MDREIELTILMPCLNEAETLEVCIRKAREFLEQYNVSGEILIADNGSTDGSVEIAERCGARVVSIDEKGYGSALIGGCNAALGKFVIMGDADDSYDFLHLMPFLDALREGYDLVMGNRFAGGIEKGAMPPLHKYLGNPVLSFIGRVLYPSPVRDFHCGLRGYNKESIQSLHLHTTGMEYASEMVVQATLHDLRITEVPTTLKKDGRSRPPHLRSWSDGWRHLTFLLMHSPNWLFLYPGVFLFLLGLFSGIVLEFGSVSIGGVRFDITTLFYAAMFVVIGFQLIIFSVLTKVYASNTGFIPYDRKRSFLYKVTMNKGIAIGCIMVGLSIAGAIISLVIWASTQYTDLDPSVMFRITIPVMVLLISGLQLLFSSFFLGILDIKLKK